MPADISSFYRTVLGHEPYPYQKALAPGEWPDLLDIPTGLGKTAAIYFAWQVMTALRAALCGACPCACLWNRRRNSYADGAYG